MLKDIVIVTLVCIIILLMGDKIFQPPQEFNDRLSVIPESCTTIDNNMYNEKFFVEGWWDLSSKSITSGLHALNPVRRDYFQNLIREHVNGSNLNIVDIGCGGGILTEALAIINPSSNITGLDQSSNSIQTAADHAKQSNVNNIHYAVSSAYSIPLPDSFADVVVMSDVLEHLHDLTLAMSEVSRILKPGGIFLYDTINRNRFTVAFIIFTEHIIKIIPRGAHDWRLFITPDEMIKLSNKVGLSSCPPSEMRGMSPRLSLKSLENIFMSILSGNNPCNYIISDIYENGFLFGNYLGYSLKNKVRL
ncbi:ubiquinone biosynthesis O-methyltransferase [Acrasis kona]|uniref:Ubiquinone biosynthesis O-methyltransferase n=1 Tax=Acrasis kona TaxID=1008807 RepID=A0AAW2YH15_9EUKA